MDKNDASPLDTLRQLKEWLDAGTITPQEFETLKRKLLFSENPPAAPSPPPTAAAPAAPVAPPTPSVVPPAAASVPPVVEHHVTPPPVEEPLLPPVVTDEPAARVEPVVLRQDHFRREPIAPPPGPAVPVADEEPFDGPAEEPRRQPLATVLIVAGVLALLAVIGYLLLGNRESERLTSNSITAADTTTVQVEEGPQAEQLTLPPVAAPETIRVQPNIPVTAQPTDSAAAGNAAATPGAPAPDPATTEAAIRSRVQRSLTALYNDMEAAPFSASQHFAPQVERFYTLQNTTPGAIEAELNRSHFPEFLESQISFDPSSLQISPVTEDGTVTVTYNERGRSLRKSRNQYQQTVAQVRARLDRNGKLTYFRQERLLENTFTDAAPTPAATETSPPQE
ncbi:SHOCT domain-containing protein [Hymenobacter oligotrophus]|uniref:SHOCT domain-containing protein n=1 Tax=Hymenobacter oligotrophus TaxID=2319843 RepID=A0A3B7R524_9BACT|nr:SHOCT domain-containing protein [Hymenobacter oligotrophus]AYA38523.1 SHOCT domain-containing protein [Hymenobacter oligotrophus]